MPCNTTTVLKETHAQCHFEEILAPTSPPPAKTAIFTLIFVFLVSMHQLQARSTSGCDANYNEGAIILIPSGAGTEIRIRPGTEHSGNRIRIG